MYANVLSGGFKDRSLPGGRATAADINASFCPFGKAKHSNTRLALIVLGISHADSIYRLKRDFPRLDFHPMRLPAS